MRVLSYLLITVLLTSVLGILFFRKDRRNLGAVVLASPFHLFGGAVLVIAALAITGLCKGDQKKVILFEIVFFLTFVLVGVLFFDQLYFSI